MSQISNTCTCGLQTVTSRPNRYGEVGWVVADVHTIREDMGLSVWEDHEAEAFLEVHDSVLSEIQTATGWECIMDFLHDAEDE